MLNRPRLQHGAEILDTGFASSSSTEIPATLLWLDQGKWDFENTEMQFHLNKDHTSSHASLKILFFLKYCKDPIHSIQWGGGYPNFPISEEISSLLLSSIILDQVIVI